MSLVRSLLALALAALANCTPIREALPNDPCQDDAALCGDHLACVSGLCMVCGAEAQACCQGQSGLLCDGTLECIAGSCTYACGRLGDRCCPRAGCTEGTCVDGRCLACGEPGQACCGAQRGGGAWCAIPSTCGLGDGGAGVCSAP